MEVGDKLQEIKDEWCIIGSSALILSDVSNEETFDIDILTTKVGSDNFQRSLKEYIEVTPKTKEDHLFRSDFARFNFPLMDIEIMGGLQVKKDGIWQDVIIEHFREIAIGNMSVKVPTLEEQKRLFLLFGREKDLKRVSLCEQNISKKL